MIDVAILNGGMTRVDELPDLRGAVVAVDTEGGGLYVDDFAWKSRDRCRLSAVSIAWLGEGGGICSAAFPFDQERYAAKTDAGARPMLWEGEEGGDDPNLDWQQWLGLLDWLGRNRLVMQKAKHDLHFLAAGTRAWPGIDLSECLEWDTLLASRVLEPKESAGLEAIGRRHFGIGKLRSELDERIAGSKGRYGTPTHPRYDLVPWRILEPYAKQDAELTLRAYLWQEAEFAKLASANGPEARFFLEEMELVSVLFHMERAGVEYDREAAGRAVELCRIAMAKLETQLPFRPTATEAAGWFFGGMKALPHCKTEKRGRPSVKECCVRELTKQPKVAEVAKLYQRWVKIDSAVNKYYGGWTRLLGPDKRLRTDFNQTGTVSGRFSSERVNLQAVPNEYRHEEFLRDLEALVGTPGEVALPRRLLFPSENAWEFDLQQAELRMATSYAGCKLMRELLEGGADVHSETAEMLFGSRDKQSRQVAKRCNFALIYNVGPKTFMLDIDSNIGLKLTEVEAKGIIDKWRKLYPEIPNINYQATRKAEQRGWVRLWDGRKRWFSEYELQFHSSKAFNQVIQGGIAQIAKQWMIGTEREFPGVLRLQIHDSIVCVLPVENELGIGATIEAIGQRIATPAAGIEMPVEGKRWRYEKVTEPTAYAGHRTPKGNVMKGERP